MKATCFCMKTAINSNFASTRFTSVKSTDTFPAKKTRWSALSALMNTIPIQKRDASREQFLTAGSTNN